VEAAYRAVGVRADCNVVEMRTQTKRGNKTHYAIKKINLLLSIRNSVSNFANLYFRLYKMTLRTIFHTTDVLITDQVSAHSRKIILNMVNFLTNGKFSYCVQLEEFSLFDSRLINLLYPAATELPTKERFLSGLPLSPL
jgi:hypothetical protein